MKIVVPYTRLRRGVIDALVVHAKTFTLVNVAASDEAYFDLLANLWGAAKTFVLVEHDIVVNETTIDELKVCDHDWCAMGFPYRGEEKAYSLACTKFSAELIRKYPDLMEIVGQMSDSMHDPMHWCRLDMWMFMVLDQLGETRHEHARSQPVGHIGEQFPKHGCLIDAR